MRARLAGAGLVLVLASAVAFATPVAAAQPAYCRDATLRAENLPARFSLHECRAVGRTVVGGGTSAVVPEPGQGVSIRGLGSNREVGLDVRTTPDGFVEVSTSSGRDAISAAAASNDNLATAEDVAPPNPYDWSVQGSTADATVEPADDEANTACAVPVDEQPQQSVWFAFTAARSGEVVVDVAAGTATTAHVFTVFEDVLNPARCNGENLYAAQGETYYIRVGTRDTGAAFTLSWHAPRPFNDAFSAANVMIPSESAYGYDTEDMFGATLETGEIQPTCKTGAAGTVWHRVNVGTLRRLDINAADGMVAVHRGSTLSTLTQITCLTSVWGRYVILPATGPYYIQHWTSAAQGRGQLWVRSGEPEPSSPNPCDESSRRLMAVAPRRPLRWRFASGTTPASLQGKALTAIKQGMAVITGSKNDCGLADQVSARTEYLGTTARRATMCTTQRTDGVNTVDFGPAGQSGQLGVACSQQTSSDGITWRITETDIRMTRGAKWTLSPDGPSCSNASDFVGVMAHEVGHAFGLDHPYGYGNQTMAAYSGTCNGGYRTLGRGDVRALRARY